MNVGLTTEARSARRMARRGRRQGGGASTRRWALGRSVASDGLPNTSRAVAATATSAKMPAAQPSQLRTVATAFQTSVNSPSPG